MNPLLDQSGSDILDQSGSIIYDQGEGESPNPPLTNFEDSLVMDASGTWQSLIKPLINDGTLSVSHTWSSDQISRADGLRTRWKGDWEPGTYGLNDQVLDDGWLMIANMETTDRASPQPVGIAGYGYVGAAPTAAVTVKQVIFGQRYTAPPDLSYQLTKYRVYVTAGNSYRVFSVVDPLTAPRVNELVTFDADTDGWAEFNISPAIVPAGQVFDLLAIVTEPDQSPSTFNGDWSYFTPNNVAVPVSGQIVHANQATSEFRISKTDNNLVDRSGDLAGLETGDIIDWGGGGTRWAIQSIQDNGTWYNFGVAPASQESPDGVHNFTFETTSPTPITRMEDPNWWALNQPTNGGAVQGLYVEDEGYGGIVANDNAYGTDIFIQELQKSDDWDIQSYMDAGGSVPEQTLTRAETDWVRVSAEAFITFKDIPTTDNTWTTVHTLDIPVGAAKAGTGAIKAVRQDMPDYYITEVRAIAFNTGGGVAADDNQIYELGQAQLDVRLQAVGLTAEVQVRGQNNQDWSWGGIFYFSDM